MAYLKVQPNQPNQPNPPIPPSQPSRGWISTSRQEQRASQSIACTFLLAFATIVLTGVLGLAMAATGDLDFENLQSRVRGASCLRVARRADYAVVFVNLGSPSQRLKLLLQLDGTVAPGAESLLVFSERMHKSMTMRCTLFEPTRSYERLCRDVVQVARNQSTITTLAHVDFAYQNDQVELSNGNVAAMAGLDGIFRLVAGKTYWLTSSHLCFAPYEPESAHARNGLAFTAPSQSSAEFREFVVASDALVRYAPTRHVPVAVAAAGSCNHTYSRVPIRLFPIESTNERSIWLSLSDTFLYEYGSDILDQRRAVVEVGPQCAALDATLDHVADLYQNDCGLALRPCQVAPAVPYRRLATSKMRFDIAPRGNGTLRVERTDALSRVPSLLSYTESLNFAVARLAVLLLTAAIVFVRGSQNAASARFMLSHTLDVVRCRNAFSEAKNRLSLPSHHEKVEVATDAAISLAALVARIVVLIFSYENIVADGNEAIVTVESIGIAASGLHFIARYTLDWNLNREAPLTKLGGPMSVIDVTSAVLLLFSDAPLLGNDDGRFAAIGRLLISMLISLAVFPRCAFSAAMVALMAASATNGKRHELTTHRNILTLSVVLWVVQAATSTLSVVVLFVNPAALSMTRSTIGDASQVKFAIFMGLVAASLPTFTKVALRTAEHECNAKKSD